MSSANTTDNISRTQDKIEQVRNVMSENIEYSLTRGEELENLQQKSHELQQSAKNFHRRAQKTRLELCLQSYKQNCCIFFIFVLIIYFLSIIICGVNLDKC